ncbi:MAG: 4Fe-4S cluster-binding domain-containing protein [Candidatus Aminicenantes bacterium]|nr:4Fe-4S cluster-binding domain-containing protein [Candidatus Aminicenantes bacterium]
MHLYSLTLFVTEDCNFNCTYCYQKKRKSYIKTSTIEKAFDFLFSFLTNKCFINFYGGEPLLAFEQIGYAVDLIQNKNKKEKKQIQYTITTNGSLLNDNVLEFFNQHQFSLLLSFDGTLQDITRKKGSFQYIVPLIEKILKYPSIDLEVNSIITPAKIGYLANSIQFVVELGVPSIIFTPCRISSWDHKSLIRWEEELRTLRAFISTYYKRNREIPLANFRRNRRKGIFSCYAGKDRMTLMPDGKLWGCYLIADCFKENEESREHAKYCFGNLDEFIKNQKRIYPEILSNYSELSMDHFYSRDNLCTQCDELNECVVCPMSNILSGSDIKTVPPWICEQNKILIKEKRLFWKEIEEEE